jgi:hypothetical protein
MPSLLLKGDEQLSGLEGVEAQIVNEAGIPGDGSRRDLLPRERTFVTRSIASDSSMSPPKSGSDTPVPRPPQRRTLLPRQHRRGRSPVPSHPLPRRFRAAVGTDKGHLSIVTGVHLVSFWRDPAAGAAHLLRGGPACRRERRRSHASPPVTPAGRGRSDRRPRRRPSWDEDGPARQAVRGRARPTRSWIRRDRVTLRAPAAPQRPAPAGPHHRQRGR